MPTLMQMTATSAAIITKRIQLGQFIYLFVESWMIMMMAFDAAVFRACVVAIPVSHFTMPRFGRFKQPLLTWNLDSERLEPQPVLLD